MTILFAWLFGPLMHQPIRTLEQPLPMTMPIGEWPI
ncbi:hypothetical protein ATK86_5332 [Nocardia fluminea]|uniref:Uncharacterized protein n=1 Tax=Nocardia fluminea TaxID=134984 RepID=A0A2N3VH30_9NOCA|nr:hypothetical protein ATK86_5332 [Nocardia fluminea]